VVAEVTTRIRSISAEVRLDESDGMPKTCVANFDAVHTLEKKRILSYITSLTPGRLIEMDHAIHFALGLDD
jgi:mRNA-degrading endonuclease toxin of MazEF toxin-antitoxin module